MRRRSLVAGLAVAVAGTVTGCAGPARPSTGQSPRPGATGAASATGPTSPSPTAGRTPMFASTFASSLGPREVTPYRPPAGAAPRQSFAVGRRDLTFTRGGTRRLPVRVWYPAGGSPGGEPPAGAAPAAGRFPVVLFSHGLTAAPDDYAAMLTRWAQAGFVVAAPRYPHTARGAEQYDADDVVNQCADASHVLSMLFDPDAAGGDLAGHLDADRVGAAGHSAGGITTAGLFSSERDPRLRAGIILSGTDFGGARFAGPAAAMLFVHGRRDDSVAYQAGRTVFAAVPWSRAMLTIDDGGHVTTGADFEAVTGTSTEFLRWSLYGDTAAKARMPAKAAVGSVATLENQL